MLNTTARYIYTVYKLQSVSKAAQELFVSQPALSRAIKKEEDELGFEIFNRKTLPFSLTVEGKIYIEALEKMLQIEREASERVGDIRHMHGGTLRIATSTHLSFYVIPKILRSFQKEFPQVDTHIIITDTNKLYEHLEDEMADMVFAPDGEEREGYEVTELLNERFVVVMTKSMANEELLPYAVSYHELCEKSYGKEKEICDMSLFGGLEFVYNSPNTNIQKKRKLLFGKSGITPYITANADRQQLNYNLMRSGFGALLTTDANIATMRPDSKCEYFVLGGEAKTRSFSIIYPKKNDGSNHITEEFVKSAKRIFECENPILELLEK